MTVSLHERIGDPAFRRAVELLDAGDAAGLRAHLADHPRVVRDRVTFEEGGYFGNATLLAFAAENPIRRGALPPGVVDAARVVLDAGGDADAASVQDTLGLVASGRVARESGVQIALIDLLCEHGADPGRAMARALTHGEFEAASALLDRGAAYDLPVAAALGRIRDVEMLLPDADALARHRALAWAAQHGHAEVVQVLLDAGEDPNRFNPPGTHAHSTPLHQAVAFGHAEVVRLLLDRGAGTAARDTIYGGTPLDWAEHGVSPSIADVLRTHAEAMAKGEA